MLARPCVAFPVAFAFLADLRIYLIRHIRWYMENWVESIADWLNTLDRESRTRMLAAVSLLEGR